MISDWLAFWDSPHFIYVNARHKDVHYRLIADKIAALMLSREARVLDYGSGEALHANLVAAAAGELLLCEAAPGVRVGLEKRFAGNFKIQVVAPHEIARLPEHSLDLIVMHSVAQYLTAAGTAALFVLFHRLLKPDGLLVVSDVILPDVAAATDAWALLRFGEANGFFFGPVSYVFVGLLAPALPRRRHALCRSRLDRETRRRRLRGGSRQSEPGDGHLTTAPRHTYSRQKF